MPANEVYPNPTVKQVAFQLTFPNLFYIEGKIGDLQLRIMEKFPESQLLLAKTVFFANVGSEQKLQPPPDEEGAHLTKIWKFKSPTGVELDIKSDSLSLRSSYHKTYNNSTVPAEDRFRTFIKFAVDKFLEINPIPMISRIGLRYVDYCPLPDQLTDEKYQAWYATTFPLSRFHLPESILMEFHARVMKGECVLAFREKRSIAEDVNRVTLDCDASRQNVKSEDYLTVTDQLHELVADEFEKAIKEPVRRLMRAPKE